jgi:hypothetical protein
MVLTHVAETCRSRAKYFGICRSICEGQETLKTSCSIGWCSYLTGKKLAVDSHLDLEMKSSKQHAERVNGLTKPISQKQCKEWTGRCYRKYVELSKTRTKTKKEILLSSMGLEQRILASYFGQWVRFQGTLGLSTVSQCITGMVQ